jgi:FMN-dependent NADH-azoreductase
VQLPGGNELVGLYSEYVNLANDLKVRKNALGMKPGIESESILDSATSGLYDDVAIGKTSGAFTSLARALQNPDGPDAAAWAAQKSDTANKLKTGATMAGIGAVGGAVGNLLINNDKDDDKSKNSDAKKEGKKFDKQKVGQDDVKKLTDTVKQKVSKSQQQKSGGQNEAQNQVAADAVVVAAPYWDMMFPAVLKTYLESITVSGITFRYSESGRPESLCRAKSLYYVTTSGGFIGQNDFGFSYVKALSLTFFGIAQIHRYTAEGLDIRGADVEKIMHKAKLEVASGSQAHTIPQTLM